LQGYDSCRMKPFCDLYFYDSDKINSLCDVLKILKLIKRIILAMYIVLALVNETDSLFL
jgi:hypothetical protein